jgi:hypothetical protein
MRYTEKHWQELEEDLRTNIPPNSDIIQFDQEVHGSLAVEYSRHGLNVTSYITSDGTYGDTELLFFNQNGEEILRQKILTNPEKELEWDGHDLQALWCHFYDEPNVKQKIELW